MAEATDELRITIPGEPVGQGRARSTLLRRKGGALVTDRKGQPIISHYDPEKSRNWKAAAHDHMAYAMRGRTLHAGAVRLQVTAFFTCPRTDWRKTKPRPRRWHTKKPDGDNVVKAVKDAAKGVLWIDDCQVADTRILKVIAAQGEAPRVEIVVQAIPN